MISLAPGGAARRAEQREPDAAKSARPEITAGMQTYVDLHRHAAVRTELLGHPMTALRLMLAHAVAGSPLWTLRPDPRTARHDETLESAEGSRAEAVFDAARRDALALLESPPDEPTLVGAANDRGAAALFLRLLALGDEAVLGLVPLIMAETLMAGSAAVEALGTTLRVDMAEWWVPRWMRFAPGAYTGRGGVATVEAAQTVEAARAALAARSEAADDGTKETDLTSPASQTDEGQALAA